MAIISQQRQIFDRTELEILGDLDKVATGFKIYAR